MAGLWLEATARAGAGDRDEARAPSPSTASTSATSSATVTTATTTTTTADTAAAEALRNGDWARLDLATGVLPVARDVIAADATDRVESDGEDVEPDEDWAMFDVAPWDAALALGRLASGGLLASPGPVVEKVEQSGEKVGIVEGTGLDLLRTRVLVRFSVAVPVDRKLTPNEVEALECLLERLNPKAAALMPVESMLERMRMVREEPSAATGPEVPKGCKLLPAQVTQQQKARAFRLASLYKMSHLVSTGRLEEGVGSGTGGDAPTLEAWSSMKEGQVVLEPRANASRNAAHQLMEMENEIQARFLPTGDDVALFTLPAPLLHMVAGYLRADDLRHLRLTCKYLDYTCCTVVPGVKVSLYSHQKRAIRWMDRQERGYAGVPDTESNPSLVMLPTAWVHGESPIEGQMCVDRASGKMRAYREEREATIDNRRRVRGGLLCDEPGLGKTVTMLSMILRSAGMAPQTPVVEKQELDQAMVRVTMDDMHWKAMDRGQRKLMLEEIFAALMKFVRSEALPTALRVRESALLSMHLVWDEMGETNRSFTQWMERCEAILRVTSLWFPRPDSAAIRAVWEPVITAMIECARTTASKICMRFYEKSSRSCASRLHQKEMHRQETEGLIMSGATLVVVPTTLIGHWEDQIKRHVDARFVGDGDRPLSELFFFDRSLKRALPDASRLAKCVAVVVPASRLSREESRHQHDSVLRRIQWLRVTVDEGHSLGTCTQTLYGNFLMRVVAQRRWVMTGTPAKETSVRAGLQSVLGLFRFLQYPPYGHANGLRAWNSLIARPLERRVPLGALRFVRLLVDAMLRHTKVDVAELPPLVLRSVGLPLLAAERDSYNTIVSYGRANIALTSIGDVGFDISLLNARNQKLAHELMRNIRRSCSGGGRMMADITDDNWVETRHLLTKVHGADALAIRRANEFIMRVSRGEKTACQNPSCNVELSMVLLTPCVHFMCVECFENYCSAPRNFHCLACQKPFSGNKFAALQPGFQLRWVGDESTSSSPRSSSSSSSAALTNIDTSSKAQFIMRKVIATREALRQQRGAKEPFKCILYSQFREVLNVLGHQFIQAFGSDAVAEFWGQHRQQELKKYTHNETHNWTCPKCAYTNDPLFKVCERSFVTLEEIGHPAASASLVPTEGEEVPGDSLAEFFPGKVFRLLEHVVDFAVVHGESVRRVRKVVKVRRCTGKARHAEWTHRKNVDCFLLLLSRDGSTGLDLSMTTHIFLVDKIWDVAVTDQVVSRAWRLGTRARQVEVMQLFMQNTVEELLYDWAKRDDDVGEEIKRSEPKKDGGGDENDDDDDNNGLEQILSSNKRSRHQKNGQRSRFADQQQDFGKLRYLLNNMSVLRDAKKGPLVATSSAPKPKRRRVCFA
ncbi:F-box protein At3g54460 [Durusdinium trenchii]|uniref:F-box protein At3g54460 n=1 Tax=Durusdinium trenchii TaxID=1381693 RepID=A0ABP0HDG6_9DINO